MGGRNTAKLPPFQVRRLARDMGLIQIQFEDNPPKVTFIKKGTSNGRVRIEVFYTTGTVKTCLAHDRQGSTQMFRQDVDFDELEKIFWNPRIHTNKGYKTTANKPGVRGKEEKWWRRWH